MAETPERQPINFKQHDELWVTLNKDEPRIRELERQLREMGKKMQPEQWASNEADFGVVPYRPDDAVVGACGILDVVKGEWGEEWSEHDQKVRAGLSRILSQSLLSSPEPGNSTDYQGYCLRRAHPETPNIVCLCANCSQGRRIRELEQERDAALTKWQTCRGLREVEQVESSRTAISLQAQLAAVTQQLIIARTYVQEWADYWSTREQMGITHTVRNSLDEIDDVLREVGHER